MKPPKKLVKKYVNGGTVDDLNETQKREYYSMPEDRREEYLRNALASMNKTVMPTTNTKPLASQSNAPKVEVKPISESSGIVGDAMNVATQTASNIAARNAAQKAAQTAGAKVAEAAGKEAGATAATAGSSVASAVPWAAVGELAGEGVRAIGTQTGDDSSVYATNIGADALTRAGQGAAIGTLFGPGVGTAVGAGIGALVGGVEGWYKSSKQTDANNSARNQNKINAAAKASGQGVYKDGGKTGVDIKRIDDLITAQQISKNGGLLNMFAKGGKVNTSQYGSYAEYLQKQFDTNTSYSVGATGEQNKMELLNERFGDQRFNTPTKLKVGGFLPTPMTRSGMNPDFKAMPNYDEGGQTGPGDDELSDEESILVNKKKFKKPVSTLQQMKQAAITSGILGGAIGGAGGAVNLAEQQFPFPNDPLIQGYDQGTVKQYNLSPEQIQAIKDTQTKRNWATAGNTLAFMGTSALVGAGVGALRGYIQNTRFKNQQRALAKRNRLIKEQRDAELYDQMLKKKTNIEETQNAPVTPQQMQNIKQNVEEENYGTPMTEEEIDDYLENVLNLRRGHEWDKAKEIYRKQMIRKGVFHGAAKGGLIDSTYTKKPNSTMPYPVMAKGGLLEAVNQYKGGGETGAVRDATAVNQLPLSKKGYSITYPNGQTVQYDTSNQPEYREGWKGVADFVGKEISPIIKFGLESATPALPEGAVNSLIQNTSLKNTYKLNPKANKENPFTYLYRTQEADSKLAARQLELSNKVENNIPLTDSEEIELIKMRPFAGRWADKTLRGVEYYIHPNIRNIQNPQILRMKIPTKNLAEKSVQNIPKAKAFSRAPKREFIVNMEDLNKAEKFQLDDLDKLIEEHNKFNTPHWLKGFPNGFANGGAIIGAGGPKDDKISAEIEDGSFIVPAENATIAEFIRENYLNKPKTVANLKQGGKSTSDVMLSNGEHMFTKEEVAKLTKMGIDLNQLAPNADSDKKLEYGGAIALGGGGFIGSSLINMTPLQLAVNKDKVFKAAQVGLDIGQMIPATAGPAYLASVPFTINDVAKDLYNQNYKLAGQDALGLVPGLKAFKIAKNGQKVIDTTSKVAKNFKKVNSFVNGYNLQNDASAFKDGGIHIKPSKKGTFTAAAKKHGKGVQEFASQVMSNKENYSPAMVKKANFAKNASKWHHVDGGEVGMNKGGLLAMNYKDGGKKNQSILDSIQEKINFLGLSNDDIPALQYAANMRKKSLEDYIDMLYNASKDEIQTEQERKNDSVGKMTVSGTPIRSSGAKIISDNKFINSISVPQQQLDIEREQRMKYADATQTNLDELNQQMKKLQRKKDQPKREILQLQIDDLKRRIQEKKDLGIGDVTLEDRQFYDVNASYDANSTVDNTISYDKAKDIASQKQLAGLPLNQEDQKVLGLLPKESPVQEQTVMDIAPEDRMLGKETTEFISPDVLENIKQTRQSGILEKINQEAKKQRSLPLTYDKKIEDLDAEREELSKNYIDAKTQKEKDDILQKLNKNQSLHDFYFNNNTKPTDAEIANKAINAINEKPIGIEESTIAPYAVEPDKYKFDESDYKGKDPLAKQQEKESPWKDVGLWAGLGQIGTGLYNTLAYKRPIDQITPEYAQAIADAQAAAKTGYTPQERKSLENEIELVRRSGADMSGQMGGGSTATAMANIRASNIDASNSLLKLGKDDAELRRANQQYATGLLGQLDARKRQIFEDSLNAYKETQSAGAELLGAGIDNLVKRQRAKQWQKFLKEDYKNAGTVNLNIQ